MLLLSVFMLNAAKYRYGECHYDKCHGAPGSQMIVMMQSCLSLGPVL
jgi:hypothetical protein